MHEQLRPTLGGLPPAVSRVAVPSVPYIAVSQLYPPSNDFEHLIYQELLLQAYIALHQQHPQLVNLSHNSLPFCRPMKKRSLDVADLVHFRLLRTGYLCSAKDLLRFCIG